MIRDEELADTATPRWPKFNSVGYNWRKISIALVDAIFKEQKAQTCENAVLISYGTIFARMAYFRYMEPISRASKPHVERWMVACLASTFSTVAALAYLFYMANGIAAGAIVGLPGRETDVAVAQHHAIVWLVVSAVFQFAVVIALFSLLRFGAEADRLVRLASRGLVATLLSFVTTFVVGLAIFETLNLLRPHLR